MSTICLSNMFSCFTSLFLRKGSPKPSFWKCKTFPLQSSVQADCSHYLCPPTSILMFQVTRVSNVFSAIRNNITFHLSPTDFQNRWYAPPFPFTPTHTCFQSLMAAHMHFTLCSCDLSRETPVSTCASVSLFKAGLVSGSTGSHLCKHVQQHSVAQNTGPILFLTCPVVFTYW